MYILNKSIPWAYLMGDDTEHKKAKGTKKRCNKKRTYP